MNVPIPISPCPSLHGEHDPLFVSLTARYRDCSATHDRCLRKQLSTETNGIQSASTHLDRIIASCVDAYRVSFHWDSFHSGGADCLTILYTIFLDISYLILVFMNIHYIISTYRRLASSATSQTTVADPFAKLAPRAAMTDGSKHSSGQDSHGGLRDSVFAVDLSGRGR